MAQSKVCEKFILSTLHIDERYAFESYCPRSSFCLFLTDLTSFLNYIPSTGPQPIFPKATFMTCPGEDNDCKVESVKATVKLETAHIGKGCDRDTYSLWSQRRLCGANQQAVELLPPDKNIAEQRDQGHLSDATITRLSSFSST